MAKSKSTAAPKAAEYVRNPIDELVDAWNLTGDLVLDAINTALPLIDGERHERERAVSILILARNRLDEELNRKVKS
ncbi:MAG TPA: hypothetical protein VK130_08230 [Steroidobacteraceae bacterium]|nr:hypothetical protein [Steroidobacteraceae bacterium]